MGGPARAEKEYSVKVGGLTDGVSPEAVRDAIEDAGVPGENITDLYFPDKFVRLGFGFVRFSNPDDAERVASMEDLVVQGVTLRGELCTNEKKRPGMSGRAPSPPAKRTRGYDAPVVAQSARGGGNKLSASEYSIWVSPFPARATADQLRQAVEDRGVSTITDVYVPGGRGFAFVRFGSQDDAEDALEKCQGLDLDGQEMELKISKSEKRGIAPMAPAPAPRGNIFADARGGGYGQRASSYGRTAPAGAVKRAPALAPAGGNTNTEHSVWVGGLPSDVSKGELRRLFEAQGVDEETMTDVYVPPGKDFGFVRFATEDEARQALHKCEGMELGKKQLELKLSTTEKIKGGGGAPMAAGGGFLALPQPGFGVRAHGYGMPVGGGGSVHGDIRGRADYGAPAVSRRTQEQEDEEISLKVGNIPLGISSDVLREAFEANGINTMTDVYIPRGKGYGFLRFRDPNDADAAMECNGMTIGGAEIVLEQADGSKKKPAEMARQDIAPAKVRGSREVVAFDDYGRRGIAAGGPVRAGPVRGGGRATGEVSVKVGNLPIDPTAEELRDAFESQGVTSMTDCYVPSGRRFGFLRFADERDAEAALDLAGMDIRGEKITCEFAEGGKKRPEEMARIEQGEPPSFGYGARADYGDPGYAPGRRMGVGVFYGGGPVAGGKGGGGAFGAAEGEVSVKVGNLPIDTTVEELGEAFAAQGVDCFSDCYIPPGRRFGFLRFRSPEEGNLALNVNVRLGGQQLEVEPAVNTKRSAPQEMVGGPIGGGFEGPPAKRALGAGRATPALVHGSAPRDDNIRADAPSVKVSSLPRGTTSAELHDALMAAGCQGQIADVYVPKGDRGFGFVRFAEVFEAEEAALLSPVVRRTPVQLEVAVKDRKAPREEA